MQDHQTPNQMSSTPPPGAPLPNASQKPTSNLAIASLVCGVAGFACGGLPSIPAIICGHMARAQIKKDPSIQGSGMALAGLILGYLMLVLIILYVLVVVGLVIFGVMTQTPSSA